MHKLSPKQRLPIIFGGSAVLLLLMALLSWGMKKSTQAYQDSKSASVHYPQVDSAKWVTQIESLCILVDESYTGLEGHTEWIAEELQGIFERIGIKASIGESAECGARLEITLAVTPIAESVAGAGQCYLSASAEGKARLSASGRKTLTLALSKPPPSRKGFGIQIVSKCPRTPADAPIKNTWATAIAPLLRWWGAPALVSALQSELSELRWVISNQFAALGPAGEEAIPVLAEMLLEHDTNIRSAAANALGSFGAKAESAVPQLIEAYQQASQTEGYSYLRALGQIGDARAVPLLQEVLRGADWYSAYEAAEALANFGETAAPAVPDLIALLASEQHQVVTSAIEVLGKIGPAAMDAVPHLIKFLAGSESSYYYPAETALEAISGQKLGRDASAWQKWWDAR